MKQPKYHFLAVLSLIFLLGGAFYPVFADSQKDAGDQILPESEGVYDVPGHPQVKLRVFVYKAKGAPGATTPPGLACSLTDDNTSTSVPGWTKWKLPADWTYTLNPASVPATVGGTNLAAMASEAFGRWSAASNGKVKLTQNSNYTSAIRAVRDSKNIIAWGRTSGGALAVTYTWYNQATGQVLENDTIMNQKFTWYWSGGVSTCAYQGVYDAQDILTHELGHWFGLNDHYTPAYTDNTMFGFGSTGETKKNTLTAGDVAGINAIY